MATLSFRLPAHRQQDAAVRRGAWARSLAVAKAEPSPLRRSGLALVTRVQELQPPTGPSMIEMPIEIKAEAEQTGATGWFDSTWDLQQGLEISEGLPADLPLGDWLKLYLVA